MNKLIPVAIFATLLISCGNNNSRPDTDKSLGIPQISAPAESSPVISPLTDSNALPQVQVTQPVSPVAAPSTVKVNPPHGQPGHRCDLQVGAPLDGSPAPAAAAPSINTTPAVAPPLNSP